MSTQTLKDKNSSIIGYIETRSDGTQVGKTRNSIIVGEGNLLASLIVSAS
jgi:hypothetical protein